MKEYVINRVFVFRKQKEVTQEVLGEKIGVTRQTVIAIEK